MDDMRELYDAALPKDVPGAWIREAIEARERDEYDRSSSVSRQHYIDTGECLRKDECTDDTGHLPGSDHRWQECPTYHDEEE